MAVKLTLEEQLARMVREGELYEKLSDQAIQQGDTSGGEMHGDARSLRCFACGHRCLIKEGRQGVCKVRFNQNGILMVPYGYVGSLQLDPIEKKPFFHAYPGEKALSFGMLGCDFHCSYCQNWITSQVLRDSEAFSPPQDITPRQFVDLALHYKASVVTSTYNEPLITSEWGVAIFKEAKKAGLITSYVSNGNGTPEVLDYLKPWLDLYKVDLKGFNDKNYRKLGGALQNVLTTIKGLWERGFWIEIVTLVVPGFNDSREELKSIADFLVNVSPDIPWHVTAFHRDYKMTDRSDTSTDSIIKAAEIGCEAGLKFVYAGNRPGEVGKYENTYCPDCKTLLIKRFGFLVEEIKIINGHCPNCQKEIPGRWEKVRV